MDVILKDPMEEWKAHTAKTLEYLSKIDFNECTHEIAWVGCGHDHAFSRRRKS